MNTIDYDCWGHCCKCHRDLTLTQVIDSVPTKRLSVDYDETEYLLDNGSKMRVAICKQCKDTLNGKDEPEIMACVKRGWKKELESLHHWSEEKKSAYMEKYGKLKIVGKPVKEVKIKEVKI